MGGRGGGLVGGGGGWGWGGSVYMYRHRLDGGGVERTKLIWPGKNAGVGIF